MKLRLFWQLFQLVVLITALFLISYSINTFLVFEEEDLIFTTTSTKVFDKDGGLLHELSFDNAVRNTPVSFEEVSPFCVQAIVATEDKTFWSNPGLDRNGVARFFVNGVTLGEYGAGGSSITQQVIKNANGSIYGRNPFTKLREAVQALKLNQLYSKQDVFELYINNIYLGNLNYGIESASQDYFGKSAVELDLAECTYLMGLPQSPSVFNPYANFEAGKQRQEIVLDSMLREELITSDLKLEIINQELIFTPNEFEIRAPHFVEFLQDQLCIKTKDCNQQYLFGNEESNINWGESYLVNSTYDYELHSKLLSQLQEIVNSTDSINNAAAVVISNEGELLTMIGSIDYFNDAIDGKFNSSLGFRQPSKTISPLIYQFAQQEDIANQTFENEDVSLVVQTGNNRNLNSFTLRNTNGFKGESTFLESQVKLLDIPATTILLQEGSDVFENYINSQIDTTVKSFRNIERESYCNEVSQFEGCEIPLYDLAVLYATELWGISGAAAIVTVSDLENNLVLDNHVANNTSTQKADSFLWDLSSEFKSDNSYMYIISGIDRYNKDVMIVMWDDNQLTAFWFGNTNGDAFTNSDGELVIEKKHKLNFD